MAVRSPTLPHYLFGGLKTAWPGANAQGFQECDVELGINTAVVVAAGRGDAALALEEAEMFRCYP